MHRDWMKRVRRRGIVLFREIRGLVDGFERERERGNG